MQLVANIAIDGLAYGMVLFVIAAGLSVTLGLMRFVNLAHGAFAMVGGYVAAFLTRSKHSLERSPYPRCVVEQYRVCAVP